jgi:transglutaminase-like putative cysteine protease
MIPPPLLVGSTLLFWGWMTGFIWVAIALAALMELPRILRVRWDISLEDFQRIWTVCCLVYLGVGAIRIAMGDSSNEVDLANPSSRLRALREASGTALTLTQWLPLFFFPLAFAQAVSVRSRIKATVFFFFFRRRLETSWFQPEINLGFPYIALSVVSASAANVRTPAFFFGTVLILSWTLWSIRPRRYPLVVWATLTVLVGSLGYAGNEGLIWLHQVIEGKSSEWLARFAGRNPNAQENRTQIGRIGRLKLSSSIVLRVEPVGTPPHLLRETSYDNYRGENWYADVRAFGEMTSQTDAETWKLLPPQTGSEIVYITEFLPGGNGLLAVPGGVTQISSLPVPVLQTNNYGVLRVLQGPGLVRLRATYANGRTFDSPPRPTNDLAVAAYEWPGIDGAIQEIGISSNTPPAEAVAAIERFFQLKFSYTTWLEIPRFNSESVLSPLGQFLLRKRAGHCEYFATATTLMLRRVGIPARYATGFAVDEVDSDNKTFIVRERHAHAWCLAWLDGAWHDVDTTPGSWFGVEEKRASMQWIKDLWFRLKFSYARWRWLKEDHAWQQILPYALSVLLGAVAWRVGAGLRRKRSRRDIAKAIARKWPGMDSELFALLLRLAHRDLDWRSDEQSTAWLLRVGQRAGPRLSEILSEIHALHLRYRFDPAGLSPDERVELRALVSQAGEELTVQAEAPAR